MSSSKTQQQLRFIYLDIYTTSVKNNTYKQTWGDNSFIYVSGA